MPLPTGPSRDAIWAALADSNYRNGGVNTNALKEMYAYIFGSGTGYSRDAFGGLGTPTVSGLSASDGNTSGGSIDVSFTLDNNGGDTCTFVAQYWVSTGDVTPSPYYQVTLGSSSTEGSHSYSISSNVTNGTQYEVRVTAYNDWNNDTSNIPAPRSTVGSYDWTNTNSATPTAPKLTTPTLSGETVQYNAADGYVSFSYPENEDSFDVRVKVDGTIQSATVDCFNANVGTSSNPKEIRFSFSSIPNSSLEVSVRATASGQTDSNWSNWETATAVNPINLPTCPL